MLIEIKNLCKKYHARANYAISGINIVGNEGEIIGILGHNGAGKSTTIKCITGMHPYEEGVVRIGGCDLAKNPIGAKQNFDELTNEIFAELQFVITGSRPCSHNCSSCHSDCNHNP